MEQKPPFIHLNQIATLNCCTYLLRDATSDDVKPPPDAATNPGVNPKLVCVFALLVRRVFILVRVVVLVEVNIYLLSTRMLSTSLSFVASTARLPR